MSDPWIDVSEWQGVIDFDQLRTAVIGGRPLVGVVMRAASGLDEDKLFARNWAEAKRVGLRRRTYQFCYPQVADGAAHARRLHQIVLSHGGYQPGEMAVCDLEAGAGDLTGFLLLWFRTTDSLVGSGNDEWYSGDWFTRVHVRADPAVTARRYWIASYTAAAPRGTQFPWTDWQYSSSGHVPGIAGAVDVDWIAATSSSSTTTPGGTLTVADLDPTLVTRGLVAWFLHEHGVDPTGPNIDWFIAHAHDVGAGAFEWEIEGALGGNDSAEPPVIANAARRLRALGQNQVPPETLDVIRAAIPAGQPGKDGKDGVAAPHTHSFSGTTSSS